jgi:hypothetical protein
LLWSAVASPTLKAQDYADFQRGITAGISGREMGFNGKFALQKILNGPCPFWSWLFSNSGRGLALPVTDAAALPS